MKYLIHNETEILATITGEGLAGTAIHPLVGSEGISVFETESDEEYEIVAGKPVPRQKTGYRLVNGSPVPCYPEDATLAAEKLVRLNQISAEAFQERNKILPDYKYLNAVAGIYGEEEKESAVELIQAYREEYYRCEQLINAKTTITQVKSVVPNWPES